MGAKRKTVFTAHPEQMDEIHAMVRSGRYESASEFLRAAIDEKLVRLRQEQVAEQVAAYCAAGHASEEDDLIAAQAFEPSDPTS